MWGRSVEPRHRVRRGTGIVLALSLLPAAAGCSIGKLDTVATCKEMKNLDSNAPAADVKKLADKTADSDIKELLTLYVKADGKGENLSSEDSSKLLELVGKVSKKCESVT